MISKTQYLESLKPKQIAKTDSCEKQTFVLFAQFGENLRTKTFDQNDLKNIIFGSPKLKLIAKTASCERQTFVLFVQYGESLCTKTFDQNDLKHTIFGFPIV